VREEQIEIRLRARVHSCEADFLHGQGQFYSVPRLRHRDCSNPHFVHFRNADHEVGRPACSSWFGVRLACGGCARHHAGLLWFTAQGQTASAITGAVVS
jgi:hypothetical protein